ncbi:MAG: DUF2779 domain-containing protein [Deltaproteobacteria bacterium]|nr:DUF2779 domain-containing protein [Deltaproteobacteria bacterium]
MSVTNTNRAYHLSKSLFIKGLKCHKYLWLEKTRPELKDEISAAQEALFQSGTDVGTLARDLFPGGVEIPYEGLSYAEQLARTAQAIADGVPAIYEAAFSYDGIFMKADILHKTVQGWHLYEVKSSTGMKDEYLDDISVQYYVLNGAGLLLTGASLVHINNQYVRQGAIDVHGLFAIQDITARVIKKQPFVTEQAAAMRSMLQADMPCIDIGPQCTDPYECMYTGYCWQHIPEHSVFSLRDRGVDKFNLYRQGIIRMEDIPIEQLPWIQRLQVEGTLYKKDHIDAAAVKEFLGTLRYPRCFLDFETTYMTPVPLHDGTRPYQQIPFQFSAHILDHEGAQLRHCEFLAPAGSDPRRQFLESLVEAVPENSCIITYNSQFETGRLNNLKEWFPEYGHRIDVMIENMVDLMLPFKQKSVYLWQLNGSYSLKDVLPVLVPELSYEELNINNGEMASNGWLALVQETDPDKVETVRKQLLEYCCLDTLAMVKIIEKLKEINPPEA